MRLGPDAVTGSLGRLVAFAQNGLEVLRFGGLDTGEEPAPFEVVEQKPMYRLRRYFPPAPGAAPRPPMVLVPPMMLAADVWDVSPSSSAVTSLHEAGVDPWVVDFGSPDREAGGLDRTLTDHVIAVSGIVDRVQELTGRAVHLGGYSQGGMFCYQAAAYRRARDIASVITFGSPADVLAGTPLGLPEEVLTKGAEFLADHVFSRLALPSWAARLGFKMLDPVKSTQSQLDFLRQLHNRDALLGRERQRRFLEGEGWVAWSGPAIVELLRQFVVHNRLMTGGFVIGDRLVTLADISCPILAFVGEVDDIGQPVAVRGIAKAAPKAEVYEYSLSAGHFGLVVGSTASNVTWPAVADWIRWREGGAPAAAAPSGVMRLTDNGHHGSGGDVSSRVTYGLTQLADVGLGATRGIAGRATEALRTSKEIAVEAVHALPRLFRLGQMQEHTRVSFGKLLDEQARRAPDGECFLFDDRVHTNAAVQTRIDNVVRGLIKVGIRQGDHVGVLMETRPSALVAIAALSRLGAVAVLLPPVSDLSAAVRLGDVREIIVDPTYVKQAATTGCTLLVLGGGGGERDLSAEFGVDVVDMERIDPDAVDLPGWYRRNPGLARDLAFILFSRSGGHTEAKLITNHRWALSAFGTASAARLTQSDTVYCITPLHHPSGLLTSVGGAVAGGSRIALSRGFDPDSFDAEVHRYGVTVVSYTWTMMRALVARPVPAEGDPHRPIRLFMGSGMPRGLWRRVTERFAPAKVLEFYASTEGDVVLANLSGAKAGAKGRPLPGSARVQLARVDPETGKLVQDESGFAVRCTDREVGLLLANPRTGVDPAARRLRGVFAPGDSWVATDDLFWRDTDGDFWLVDNLHTVIHSAKGPVYAQPICDALADLSAVDLAVAYGVPVDGAEVAVAAVTEWGEGEMTATDVTSALSALPPERRPDVVHVVDEIAVTKWYRPSAATLATDGVPSDGKVWYLERAADVYLPLTPEVRAQLLS